MSMVKITTVPENVGSVDVAGFLGEWSRPAGKLVDAI